MVEIWEKDFMNLEVWYSSTEWGEADTFIHQQLLAQMMELDL